MARKVRFRAIFFAAYTLENLGICHSDSRQICALQTEQEKQAVRETTIVTVTVTRIQTRPMYIDAGLCSLKTAAAALF